MPTYTLKNTETDEQYDVICSSDELKVLLEQPHIHQVFSFPKMITQHGSTMSRTDGDFKSHLESMKKKYPGSTIET